MKYFAPAKLNLGLRIGSRQADGLHAIDTILVRLALADELEISFRNDSEIVLEVVGGVTLQIKPAENLVYRAAILLREMAGEPTLGAAIRLTKNVPHGAGLGGGSSDAATTLVVLNQLWNLKMLPAKLAEIAVRLGSDVPFFLQKGAQRATGRGEKLTAVDLLADFPQHVLLVIPAIQIATAAAYGWVDVFRPVGSPDQPGRFVNDFEPVVFARYPALAAVRDALQKMGAVHAGLAGSGAVVFGIFNSPPNVGQMAVLQKYGRVVTTHFNPRGD